jgi:hypothetical protein
MRTLRSIAIIRALSNAWVVSFGTPFLISLLCLAAAKLTPSQMRTAEVTCAVTGSLFFSSLAAAAIRYGNEADLMFHLSFTNFDGSRNPTSGAFWYRSGYGDTLSPISATLYMSVKNTRTVPVYIERLEIGVQKRGNRWLSLRHIITEAGRLYWAYGDIGNAALLNLPLLGYTPPFEHSCWRNYRWLDVLDGCRRLCRVRWKQHSLENSRQGQRRQMVQVHLAI